MSWIPNINIECANRITLRGVVETFTGKNDSFSVAKRMVNGSSEYLVYYKERFMCRKFRKRDVETYLN